MRILSWNVNGIRASAKKGFQQWLDQSEADVVNLQEVRATFEQVPTSLRESESWHCHVVSGVRKGYSGVGIFSKEAPDSIETSMGEDTFDDEARMQLYSLGSLLIANVYFPNGNGKNRDNSRVPYKLSFYQRLFDMLEEEKQAGRPILVVGDFNTAHDDIDLARPKQNQKTSGFLPEERAEFSRWVNEGWVDTFRHFHPEEEGHYTWWRQWGNSRLKNVGWRIDYILASPGAMPHLQDAFILKDDMGSDHCPIGVVLDDEVCKL